VKGEIFDVALDREGRDPEKAGPLCRQVARAELRDEDVQ
jgi:hypothetical protein